jgi:DNA polymerase-3 subunit alpha
VKKKLNMPDSPFIHLHVHSAYSLAEGAIKIPDLINLCVKNKMPAVAVTDTNNLFGALEFAMAAKKAGIQPILGAQVEIGEHRHKAVLLVQSDTGYQNLSKLLSDAYMESEHADPVLDFDAVQNHNAGLICLCADIQVLERLQGIFNDRFYVSMARYGVPEEDQKEEALLKYAYDNNAPLVATNDCYFAESKAYEAHDALLCISEGRYVTEEDRRKVTPEHYFKPGKEMEMLFADIPEAIANTTVIAKRCSYLLEPIDPILPAFDTEGGRSEFEELKAQAEEGLKWRLTFGKAAEESEYFERLAFELDIINKMGYPGYFLIVSDFIKWAKDNNIPVGPGRGSGAGSVVAWALKITDLDPIEWGLLFERFLNPERVSMPDFDIDFCQTRRDEVIQYVQGKYGRDRVAQIITFGKLQARAVVRDVGRVLQMPYGQVDRIAKLIPNNPADPKTLQEALDADADLRAERDKDEVQKKLIDIALQLEGLYRHASTHAAGLVIADRPLPELVPVYRDPKSDMPVTQFNMKYVEQAGLVKFDFLGLKTMTVVQKAVDMVNATLCHPEREAEGPQNIQGDPSVASLHQDDKIDLLTIPLDDQKTYDLIARGDTVGVFQLESAGMRDALKKVKPTRFEDIIALVSLYRPGPMENIPAYAATKHGKQEADYMHPKLEPLLKETYGIMIYQEQVQRAAQVLSGYTLGGADLLRRAMGKKIKEEMDAQREMFVKGAAEHNNVPKDQAEHIFDQIAKFAGYGFNKSHAAAYALIAYWTAWLKANHHLEFMAASMTLDLGNTDKLAIFKQDLDRTEVDLRIPCVNHSEVEFSVEGDAIRYALAALKGVGEQAMHALVRERVSGGSFDAIEDFASRLDPKAMNKRQLEHMAYAGAFDAINDNRAAVSAGAEMILRHAQTLAEEKASGQNNLFGGDGGVGLKMPDLPDVKPWSPLEKLGYEFGAVGFYLSAHPLDSREQQFENLGITYHVDLLQQVEEKMAVRATMAAVLLKKQEKMSQKGSKYAFLQLSDPTGVFEVMMFSEVLNATREHLNPGTALLVQIEAEQKEDQIRMMCSNASPLDTALEHKIRQIKIELDNAKPAQSIKEFLDIEGSGKSEILFTLKLPDNRVVTLQLPGRHSLSPQARERIRSERGVRDVLEV